MDTLFTRLEEASKAGDVNLLKELLIKDNLLLEKVIGRTSVSDNPLHIAAMLGHADFVREVIYHKPELAKELNNQGLSPLHLAAAHGHFSVVEELLKAGSDLCLLSETQEGLLPLHIAVKKRRTTIIKVLVEACEEAVHRLTNGRETILHLAIKNNAFFTVDFLIDRVQDLNAKDDGGNTILHHAVASKQLSVIKFLFSKSIAMNRINLNPINLASLTPLDVLLGSWPQTGDLLLGETIRKAGGKTAREILFESQPENRSSVSSGHSTNSISTPIMSQEQSQCLSRKKEIQEATSELQEDKKEKKQDDKKEKKQDDKKEKKQDPKILLLVATLVATVSFQAALNPPGGVNTAGKPVLGDSLNFFQIFDMFALFSSVSVMMVLLCAVPRKKHLVMKFLVWVIWGAAFSMGLAFTMGIHTLYDYNDFYDYYIDNNNHTATDIYHYHDHWYSAPVLLGGWLVLFRVVISWVLVGFLIFLLKKAELWELIQQCFSSLKTECSGKWKQLNGTNCCEFVYKVICIVLILVVLAGIAFPWVLYKYIKI